MTESWGSVLRQSIAFVIFVAVFIAWTSVS